MTHRFIAVVMLVVTSLLPVAMSAQTKKAETKTESPSEMTLSENLLTPQVPDRQHQSVAAAMRREAEAFHKRGYRVETMRKGEVVIVTLQTDELFMPNDTVLIRDSADRLLSPFKSYFTTPGRYKVLMAVHTDNTGSPKYTFTLSENRVMALYDWFDSHVSNDDSLFGFPMGDTAPAASNDSRENRAANRRVEFYLVPDQGLIDSVRKKR